MRSHLSVFRRLSCLLGIFAVLALASSAQAATNYYGTLVGPNIMYLGIGNPPNPLGVAETTTQIPGPDPATLFGAPSISGDALVFNPLNFKVTSSGGNFTLQDGRLSMGIMTNSPLGAITGITFTEGGGFSVAGGGGGNMSQASLVVNGLFITQVNGANVAPIPVLQSSGSFGGVVNTGSPGNVAISSTPAGVTFNSAGNGGAVLGSWNGSETFNINAALALAGYAPGARATKLSLDLNNMLLAQSTNGLSFIDKKFFNINVTAVPEPSTILLGLMGGVGMLVGGRRLRKAKTA